MVDKQGDTKQLATWCVVIQKELTAKRYECRQLREDKERLKKESSVKTRSLLDRTNELGASKEQVRVLREDLSSSEDEITRLKKKLDSLSKALGSPSDTAGSFTRRMINESPAPELPRKRPKLSAPLNSSGDIDLDVSLDLFSPETVEPTSSKSSHKQNTVMRKNPEELGTKYLKITSAASSKASSNKREKGVNDITNAILPGGLNCMNIMRKKSGFLEPQSSAIRKGYNGLGGHEKFIQSKPKGNTFRVPNQTTLGQGVPRKNKLQNSKVPPLPRLDDYMALDLSD